jgi:hypothetical protein
MLRQVGKYLLLATLNTGFPSWGGHAGLNHLVRIHTLFASRSPAVFRFLIGEKRHIRVYKRSRHQEQAEKNTSRD